MLSYITNTLSPGFAYMTTHYTKLLLVSLILSSIQVNGIALADNLPPLPALPSTGSSNLSDLKLPGEPTPPALPAIGQNMPVAAVKPVTSPAPSPSFPPAFPSVSGNNNTKNNHTADLDVPPLPALPGKPSTARKQEAAKPADTRETVAANADTDKILEDSKDKKGKKKHKKHVVKANPRLAYTIRDRLPEEIYKKHYDTYNRHLPTAYYEQEYDRLVFLTAMHDDINGLRAILDSGRSPNLRDENGDTPLLLAVKNNSVRAAKLLLNRNADARIKDKNGYTAPAIAGAIGNDAMLRVFAGLD